MNNTEITVFPRLIIRGVDEAIACYREVFGAALLERFVDPSGRVVHAAVRIGASIVSMAEHTPDWDLRAPGRDPPVLLHVTVDDPDLTCERLVQAGGEVLIPVEDRFYGKREGRVRDPFGHLWILSRPLEELSDEEIRRRMQPRPGA